ncbi:MAG: N-6 DNA methylase [Clostridia bacterium]|nr:N-6 DNA methylase [Clostridia bacterium]
MIDGITNGLDLDTLERNFKSRSFKSEDDIKLHFFADIIKPILEAVNPDAKNSFYSENTLLRGGRPDASFRNICFEYKRYGYFDDVSGINEALYGRDNQKDHGLYHYIINYSEIESSDSKEEIERKLINNIGVGFDGKQFVFARFIADNSAKHQLDMSKSRVAFDCPVVNLKFIYEIKDFKTGLKRLVLLLKQQNKIALNKTNLLSKINPKSPFVRKHIRKIYDELYLNLYDRDGGNYSDRVKALYDEWNRIFGVMYGEDEQATIFNEVSPSIKEAYGWEDDFDIDSKMYLFSLQTFFNIFLKLLIYSFFYQLRLSSPSFTTENALSKTEIFELFDGNIEEENKIINNFFESHFLEWFTYTGKWDTFSVDLVNSTLELINEFDLSSYVFKPETVQDILQEIYMELIPAEMRHLMGEYFSPDWIVEHVLDMVGFTEDTTNLIDKKLIDPTCGSGTFLIQALKRIIKQNNMILNRSDIEKITNNVVGFDINPISVVSAKANYIITMFSAYFDELDKSIREPVNIPIYIADSILSPVVYAEENKDHLIIDTSVGKFTLPKFREYKDASLFLKELSRFIHEQSRFEPFWAIVNRVKQLVKEEDKPVVKKLYDDLYALHRAGKDSFWPIIFRNSFAPIMIGKKFDYVVGNPPWIAWKSMSKSYRDGTLDIWISYGIFEKNAYDKKTTHDDFGMAVTYVAIDQYLKMGGTMAFLLPASFLKSTKGGEGFRKFHIIRNGQNIPFTIEQVDDFSNVRLFTVPTIAVKFKKGEPMKYPMNNYRVWTQLGRKTEFDSHAKWEDVLPKLECEVLSAQPVDSSDKQSAWLTLKNMDFANKVLDSEKKRYYSGRKGIEPAGAKGVFILKKPVRTKDGKLKIVNDMSRQRRKDILEKGEQPGIIEEDFVYPMLGGRNIERWKVKSNEFILVPHTGEYKYGIPEEILAEIAPLTFEWLRFYREGLLDTRIQNGKFFDPNLHPFYRLDNVGEYTFSPYKVLWKEQTSSMSAVTVSTYYKSVPNADRTIFSKDKVIVVDSKVLMLALDNEDEAYYISGILNAPNIREVIDGYAVSTNRGIDVLKYLAIPKFEPRNKVHLKIAELSKHIHKLMRRDKIDMNQIYQLEESLARIVEILFD